MGADPFGGQADPFGAPTNSGGLGAMPPPMGNTLAAGANTGIMHFVML